MLTWYRRLNGKERKEVIWMPLSISIFVTMLVLTQTDWGSCAKLPCPPIPLALGIIAILGLLSFFVSILYFIFGPEQENKIIPSGSEFLVDEVVQESGSQ